MANSIDIGCESGGNAVRTLFETIKTKGVLVNLSGFGNSVSVNMPNSRYVFFAIKINEHYYYCSGDAYYNTDGTYTCGIVTRSYLMRNIGSGSESYAVYVKIMRNGNSQIFTLYISINDSFTSLISPSEFANNVDSFEVCYLGSMSYNDLMSQLGGGITFLNTISFAA